MQTYLAGNAVTLTIPLVSDIGETLTASAASYKVIDETGATLIALTPVPGFATTDTEVVVTVISGFNTLGPSQTVGAREIQLVLTTDSGTVVVAAGYRVSVADRLVIPQMSFQTLTGAEMVAVDLIGVSAWEAASKPQRVSALLEAHRRLCLFVYSYSSDDWQSRVAGEIDIDELDELTVSEWFALPVDFSNALKRAQVLEADSILGGDPAKQARDDGLLMEKIGETEQRFRDTKAPRYVVSARAHSVISRYLASGNRRLARA